MNHARRWLGPALLLAAASLAGCATNGAGDKMKSLSQLPNKDQSMLKLGDASRVGGDCVAALRFYHLALEAGGGDAEKLGAHIGTADCLVALGSLAEAKKEYAEAQKIAPDDPNAILGLGRILLISHNAGDAVSMFDLAVTKGASGPWVWNDKGVALDQLRRHKEAQDAYRAGLARYPNDRALRNNYALSLAMTSNFSDAEAILRPMAAEPDATAKTRLNLALVLGLKGNAAEAREMARNDLDGAALDNNARFYDYARAAINGTPLPPMPTAKPSASMDPELRASAERAALAAATPIPPESRALMQRTEQMKAAALAALKQRETAPPVEAAPAEAPVPVEVAHVAPAPETPPAPEVTEVTPPAPSPLVANSDGGDLPPSRAKPVASTHTADATPHAAGPVASSE